MCVDIASDGVGAVVLLDVHVEGVHVDEQRIAADLLHDPPGIVEGVDYVAFVAVHRLDAQTHAGCLGSAGQAAIDLHQLAADGRMRRAQVALHGGVGHSAQQLRSHVPRGGQGIGDELLAAAGDGRVGAGDVGVGVQGHAGDAAQLGLRQGARGLPPDVPRRDRR